MIVGIDEVGRGCWAGPVCVGAVLLSAESQIKGLADSKTLTAKRREELTPIIRLEAGSIGIGWASSKFIDNYGIVAALKKAANEAFCQIDGVYDEIIIDGTLDLLENREITLLKNADTLIPAVSAASIIAKVARDKYMARLSERFTGYGFENHVGYGTLTHASALEKLGPSAVHRMSFSPMSKKVIPASRYTSSGSIAEDKAAAWLEAKGYIIVERNWKTRWCEIDIIAKKEGVIRFFEVKYRKNDSAGSGLEYITKAKRQRMTFAAEMWLSRHNTADNSCELGALELQGSSYEVTEFITSI